VTLVPTGPGQPRTIAIPGLDVQNGNVHFLGDGKHIALNANEPGHRERTYLVDFEGGKPVPITPEGISDGLISPDGQYVLRVDAAGGAVYPTNGGPPRRIREPRPPIATRFSLQPGFTPVQWSEDNSSVYGYLPGIPAKVYKVNLVTGENVLVQELQPEATDGVVFIAPVVVTRDGSRFAYSYYQVLSVLYLISGLH
jgi:hypothetical protein